MNDADPIYPAALAFDKKDNLYVADRDGERILLLNRNRSITIAAGPGSQVKPKVGYVDGPSATARFNKPLGLAVGKSGETYIADSGNHVIRVLTPDGNVQTVAASRGAGLINPSGVASDNIGNIYIADAATGVWKIDPEQHLSKLAVPVEKPFAVATVAPYTTLYVSGSNGLAYVQTSDGWSRWFPSSDKAFAASNDQLQGFRPIGLPHALAPLSDQSLLYTDLQHSAIRYLNVKSRIGRIVALKSGVLDHPTGIALASDGTVAVSTERHGIVFLTRLDLRMPIVPAGATLVPDDMNVAKDVYRIALLGNSFIWWNTDWPDSIAGQLETKLQSLHGPPSPRVYPVLLPDGTIQGAEQYIAAMTDLGIFRMALLQVNTSMIRRSFAISPKVKIGQEAAWVDPLLKGIKKLKRDLDSHHVPLVIVAQPEEAELLDSSPRVLEQALLKLKPSGVKVLDEYPSMAAVFRRERVYGRCDKHFQPFGRRLSAAMLADYLRPFFHNGTH